MTTDFNRLLVAQMPRLRVFALSLTRNTPDADDLTQTTAAQAIHAQTQFMPGTNFAAWTTRIMRNRFYSDCRTGKRRPVALDDVPGERISGTGDGYEHALACQAVRALNRLPPPLKQALGLACGELSQTDIAAAMSCSVGTVKSRVWRARRKLRHFLPAGDHDLPPALPMARSTWNTPMGLN